VRPQCLNIYWEKLTFDRHIMYGVDLEKLCGFSFVKIGGSERDSVQKIGKLRFSFDQLLL